MQPSAAMLSLVDAIASSEGVPPELLKALVEIESAWDPKAYRAEPQIHDASYGLAQILYGTAKSIGYQGTPEGLFIPAEGLKWGARYLRRMLNTFQGNWVLAMAGYNAGPGNARKAITRSGSRDPEKIDPFLPSITRSYWKKALVWARHYAGQISRAEAIIQAKAGEVTQELLEFAKSPTGKTTGFLLLMIVILGAAMMGGRNAG